jgi:hypothetical protein
MSESEEYLGDGLYASFNGESIRLRASRDGGDHVVYLDANVFRNFIAWADNAIGWGVDNHGRIVIRGKEE